MQHLVEIGFTGVAPYMCVKYRVTDYRFSIKLFSASSASSCFVNSQSPTDHGLQRILTYDGEYYTLSLTLLSIKIISCQKYGTK